MDIKKKFKKLIKLVVFAIFGREKFLLSYQNTKAYQIYQGFLKNNLNKGKGAKICGKNLPQLLIFRTKNMNISSTQIRTKNV